MRGRHGRSPTKPGVDSGGDRKHQGDLIELTIVDHLSTKLVTEPRHVPKAMRTAGYTPEQISLGVASGSPVRSHRVDSDWVWIVSPRWEGSCAVVSKAESGQPASRTSVP